MKQERKKGYKHGTISTKAMTFKIDIENYVYLQKVENKGRLINNLLAEYFMNN